MTSSSVPISAARLLAFVGLSAGIAGVAAKLVFAIFPPLMNEPVSPHLTPFVYIVALLAAVLHPIVRRLRSSLARAFALYIAFVMALGLQGLVFAGLTTTNLTTDVSRSVLILLYFGHFLGLPVLLVIGIVLKLTSPWLTPRAAYTFGRS